MTSSDDPTQLQHVHIPVDNHTVSGLRYSPDRDDSCPVLLMYTPYRADDYTTFAGGGYDPLARYLARHGYEVVLADAVGFGASSGVKTDPSESDVEGRHAAEVIDWLAAQEWTTGRVGMFGKSYAGGTAYAAAAEDPDPLDAIVPTHASFRSDGDRFPGGAKSLAPLGGWLPMMATLGTLPPSHRDPDGRWADIWEERLDAMAAGEASPATWLFDYLDHDPREDTDRGPDIDPTAVSVPVLTTTGWRDSVTPQAAFQRLARVDAPTRLLVGPWRHVMPHRGRETQTDFRARTVEWFDHFLKDEDSGALAHPRIEYWTERDGGGRVDGGVWRGRETWPMARDDGVSALSFAVSPDGLVPETEFDEGAVSADYEYDHTVGMESTQYTAPPTDTSADDARSLCFTGSPLDRPVEWTGTGRVTLRLRATTADPLVVVRVVDVGPDGRASLVTHGQVRPNGLPDGGTDGNVRPGKEHELSIPLKPTSHVFESGHRIRAAVSAAYFPRLVSPEGQGQFTVLSTPAAASVVECPGTRHRSDPSFDDTVAVNPPDDDAVPVRSTWATASEGMRETAREHTDDTGTVRSASEDTFELPSGATMTWASEMEASVRAADPSTLSVTAAFEAEIDHGSERVVVEASSRASRETAQLSETVRIDGQLVFDETWRH
jgi:putative CocE/NonD family hydrolase